MENIITENESLREIINNINSGLYQINDYSNIRIFSNNKPDFVILCIESDASENLINFFESSKFDKKINFEKTYNDFIVVSLDKQEKIIDSKTISLFELILSSEILQLEESEKWLLDSKEFNCIEINYIEENVLSQEKIDMKFFG
jgi:hypothetical protein